MDPIVILIITMIALGGGGAGGALALRRRHRRAATRRLILEKVDHHGRPLSIFDVFWDLGVSEYALALMDHHGLLMDTPQDFERVHNRLDDLIEAHGTYTDFVEDNLTAIQEFYREHSHTGHRRKLPVMTVRHRKLLPVADGRTRSAEARSRGDSTSLVRRAEQASQAAVSNTEEARAAPAEQADDAIERDLGRVVQDSVDERRTFREERSPMLMTVRSDEQMPARSGVDVDELVKLEPLQMLKNIFDGRLTDQVQKWWRFRHLRAAKSRLDEQFVQFYDFYAALANRRPDFFEMLYDTTRRWSEEAGRIDALLGRRPWSGEPFADCAQALVEQALEVAEQLTNRARINVDATVEQIHRFARSGDRAMAGYLLYLNHHAFFAGRAPEYGEYVQRIERLAYRVQEELQRLRRDGEL